MDDFKHIVDHSSSSDGYGDDYNPDDDCSVHHNDDYRHLASRADDNEPYNTQTPSHPHELAEHDEIMRPGSLPDSTQSHVRAATESSEEWLKVDLIHVMSKDPVLKSIFRQIDDRFGELRLTTFIKLFFAKFAGIHDMKKDAIGDLGMTLDLSALEIDVAKCIINEADAPAQKAIKALRTLRRAYPKVIKNAITRLNQLILASEAQVPDVYKRSRIDDLCAVLYAIKSDQHYQPSECRSFQSRFFFRVSIITHLNLIGGKPATFEALVKGLDMGYHKFLEILPGMVQIARCKQRSRRGYSTNTSITQGSWLYQFASELGSLNPAREQWTVLNDTTYEGLKEAKEKKTVFLIHESDQAIPLAIEAKVLTKPFYWNTWDKVTPQVLTNHGLVTLPPPDFLPPCSPAKPLYPDLVLLPEVASTEPCNKISLPNRKRPAPEYLDNGKGCKKQG
ncbi:hypothetical protein D6C87_00116 [Aureobasidium pullulans]|uniref:Uncharacterized protein n=1 Tax=Aureobasidium pullulans TaxID=5580 RepID=A0AB38MA16_AURPU|nr:hypothetical protein D6C94_01210 [Aureobasidium pullulans]THZ49307.1 hypothetical protein D6C87_00116 [Aureobasidium pullulans]